MIPGIDLVTGGDLAGPQYTGGKEMMQDAIDSGIIEVKAMMNTYLSKFMKVLPLDEVDGAGMWSNTGVDADDYQSATAGNAGPEICMNQGSRINMSKIFISTIEVLTNTTLGSKDIFITDRNVTTTKNFALTAGEITTIDVFQTFESDKVWINWDTSDIDYNDSFLHVSNCSTCRSSRWKGYRAFNSCRIRGRQDIGGKIGQGMKDTFGIRVNFRIDCDTDELICKLREPLKYIIWKEAGKRYFEEAKANPGRFNAVATTKKEEIDFGLNKLMVELYGDQAEAGLQVGNRAAVGLWHQFGKNLEGILKRFSHPCIRCQSDRTAVQRM